MQPLIVYRDITILKQYTGMKRRDKLASIFLASLLANPKRYRYISNLVAEGKLTNKEATQKSIDKARMITDQFIATITNERKLVPRV